MDLLSQLIIQVGFPDGRLHDPSSHLRRVACSPAVGSIMGGCQRYGPFLGVHIEGEIDIDVDIDTDS